MVLVLTFICPSESGFTVSGALLREVMPAAY